MFCHAMLCCVFKFSAVYIKVEKRMDCSKKIFCYVDVPLEIQKRLQE